jgi:uncharacterized membrane protein
LESLIASENNLAVAAVLFCIVLAGLMAERTDLGRKISAPLIALGGGMLLSNLRFLPFESPSYGFVVSFLVPIAIPLLLLNANLRRIFRETGPTLIAFLAGAVGTVLGAIVGFHLIDLGPETHKVVSVLAATFVGGSFNFVAVSQALSIDDATLLASAATAQGVAAIFYLGFLIMVPEVPGLRRLYRSKREVAVVDDDIVVSTGNIEENTDAAPMDISASIAFSLVVCAVSFGTANLLGVPQLGILFITTITVASASLAPKFMSRLAGGERIGLLFVYVFIAAVGAQSNIWQLAGTTMVLVGFLGALLLVHVVVVFVVGRLFGLTLPEVITGSNACALGAYTAAAIAAGKRWDSLVTPGILSGILGYIIANFIGMGLSSFLATL